MRFVIFVALLFVIVGTVMYANVVQRHAVDAIAQQHAPSPLATVDLACDKASHLAKQAWSASADPSARYDAATQGLGVMTACEDADQRAFGSAMLMAVKTDAEFKLRSGNAFYDARRAVDVLQACEDRFREKMPHEATQCADNRKALESYVRTAPPGL